MNTQRVSKTAYRLYRYTTADTETMFTAIAYPTKGYTIIITIAPAYGLTDVIRYPDIFTDDRGAFDLVNKCKTELEKSHQISLS